jgi:tRNA (guanine-N7-)-methyltransferase
MKERRRRIEREFGVPIAGEILDPSQWTRTALKQLPEGLLDWESLFGRRAPVVLDLGCGNGRFLLGSAVWRADHDHLGLDILPVVIRYATRRANQRGLTNIRFAVGGAHEFLDRHVSPGGIAEIHCYHPQPYHDPAKGHRRLMTPAFLAAVHRGLCPGGLFFVQTDSPAYWQYLRQVLPAFFEFEERAGTWPDAPKGRTRREIIALRRGLAVFRATGKARQDLTREQADAMAQSLPVPDFPPDRQSLELDEWEARG